MFSLKSNFFTVLFMLFLLVQCKGQKDSLPGKGYQIDASVKKKTGKLKPGNATVDVSWLDNNEQIPFVSNKNHPSYSYYQTEKDTTTVFIMPMFTPGVGIAVTLFGDTAILLHFISPRNPAPSFRLSQSDSSYSGSIEVKSASAKLVLANAPSPGLPIQGYFEFESEVYYEKNSEGPDSKKIYKATGYFNANKM